MPSKGQFLETGYGTASNEKAFDLAISDNGLVMAGYVDSSETGHFLSIWQTDSLGHVLWHYKQEDVTQSYARSIAFKPTTSMLLSAGAIAPNFSWNEVLRDEDQLFVAAVSSSGDFAWSYTHTTTDTSTAAVDVLPTPTGFAVLANFLPDYSTYSQPYIVFLTDSGTLQGLLPLGRNDKTLLAFKMQLNPSDSSLVVAANEYTTSGKVIPTLYTINKTGTTYKSFSYTADDHCEIHSLVQDPTGNWWLAGESYNSGDTLATVIKTNYAYAKQTTITYSYSTGYSSFNDIISHSEGILATGIVESTGSFGEGYKDVLLQHLAFSGDSTLAETLGGSAHDEGQSLVLVPNQLIAFGVGYDNSYGVEESGNAYVFGVKVGEFQASGECVVPRVLWVDKFLQRPDKVEALILGNPTEENALIQFALDNEITHLALFDLGLIFDNHNNQHQYIYNSKLAFRAKLDTFITTCTANGIICGMVTDSTLAGMLNAAEYNKDTFNYSHTGKINFEVLEHEFWNAHDLNKLSGPPPHNPPTLTSAMNAHFEYVWQDHQNALDTLNQFKVSNANFWSVYDYLGFFYHRWDGDTLQNYYWHSNDTSQLQKADYLEKNTDGLFLHYYTRYNYNQGLDFLNDSNSGYWDVPRFAERLGMLGQQITKTKIIPIFSSEFYINSINFCGKGVGYNYLGQFLDDFTGNNLKVVETEYINQHLNKYYSINYPNVSNIEMIALSWYKYDCLKNYDFISYQSTYDNSRVECPVFSSTPLNIETHESTKIDISIYPNPTNSIITISVNDFEKTDVYIFDVFGKLIQTTTIKQLHTQLDFSGYTSGIYLIQINCNNSLSTFKIVKQ